MRTLCMVFVVLIVCAACTADAETIYQNDLGTVAQRTELMPGDSAVWDDKGATYDLDGDGLSGVVRANDDVAIVTLTKRLTAPAGKLYSYPTFSAWGMGTVSNWATWVTIEISRDGGTWEYADSTNGKTPDEYGYETALLTSSSLGDPNYAGVKYVYVRVSLFTQSGAIPPVEAQAAAWQLSVDADLVDGTAPEIIYENDLGTAAQRADMNCYDPRSGSSPIWVDLGLNWDRDGDGLSGMATTDASWSAITFTKQIVAPPGKMINAPVLTAVGGGNMAALASGAYVFLGLANGDWGDWDTWNISDATENYGGGTLVEQIITASSVGNSSYYGLRSFWIRAEIRTSAGVALPWYPLIKDIRVIGTLVDAPEQVATPVFSPDDGTYAVPQTVEITCETADARIYYTTDGTNPDETKTLYKGPILVNQNTTIKARAYKDEMGPSEVKAATYAFANNRPQAIPYADSAITINGDLAEWPVAGSPEWTPLDQVYAGNPFDIPEAYCAAKWKEDKVYMAVKVRDTYHKFTDSYVAWNARDAIEFYIHTTGTGPASYVATQADAQQYAIGIKPGGGVWSIMGSNQPIPTEAGFLAAGIVNGQWLQYEAAMTPFEFFSLTGQGLVISPLSSGMIIGLDALAAGHSGSTYTGMKSENLMINKWSDYHLIGLHLLVRGSSIADAKTAADGAGVGFSGIVSADFGDYFYVQSIDRAYGIRANKAGHGLTVGRIVSGNGIMDTLASGERCLVVASVSAAGTDEVEPLGMNNKTLGGGDFGTVPNGQAGVAGGAGLSNIGLLVKTTGEVTRIDSSTFTIADGSGVIVKVLCPAGSAPETGKYVAVTGISSLEAPGGNRVVQARTASDIQEFAP